jgi:hypothetical protein
MVNFSFKIIKILITGLVLVIKIYLKYAVTAVHPTPCKRREYLIAATKIVLRCSGTRFPEFTFVNSGFQI